MISYTKRSRLFLYEIEGGQRLSGRVLDSRLRGSGFDPQGRHCVVVLEQDTFILAEYWFNPGRPTRPCLAERLLMGRKESNQTNLYEIVD